MIPPGNRRKVIMVSVSLTIVLALSVLIFFLSKDVNNEKLQIPASPEFTPSEESDLQIVTPSAEPAPGLKVYGTVKDQSNAGVENVAIYRSYSSYPGIVIATTDANGYYESDFYPILGDEMVTIWAEKQGLTFKPENYIWRHYFGYEQVELNFLVQP